MKERKLFRVSLSLLKRFECTLKTEHSLSAEAFGPGTGYSEGVDYTFLWRLQEYRKSVTKDNNPAEWDELEKAVIASVADDVTVGVKGSCAKIVILKKFN